MNENLITRISEKIRRSSDIDNELFKKYQVKRGLRNADDSGVLVGLSNISDVIGYERGEDKIIPVEGKLIYRGIPINELTAGFQKDGRHGFEETIYLLLTGQLPSRGHLEEFKADMAELRNLPMAFVKTNMISNRGGDIMNMLARNILFLYTFDKKAEDTTQVSLIEQSLSLISKFPVIVAYSYHGMMHAQRRKTLYIRHPEPKLSAAENFLYMLKGERCYTALDAEILDLALALHAEHGGGNNSSFTTRVISSTLTDTYSTMAAAVGSLKGPLHGGANLRVLGMMENIKANVKDWKSEVEVMDYLVKILKKEAHNRTGKLYGIGHAVYTYSDPRTLILKEKARELAIEKDKEAEFNLYCLVEKLAPEAFNSFKKGSNKVLCANVDFYSGFVYECIGIPKEVFTPLFAIARIAGWSAHRLEELNFAAKRIIRPAYKYVAEPQSYIPIDRRVEE
jgi:citrate synthase